MPLEQFTTGEAVRLRVAAARAEGKTVGLVPTMGALHPGHLSLVEASRGECDFTVASVFVNPTQFAPDEDYQRYPRDLERDSELLAAAGCDWIFTPSVEEMYPPGAGTTVDAGAVAAPLEGEQRPTHFRGVTTVVLKLMLLAPADRAYFGRKDYQQTVVVRRMVRDLGVPIDVRVCPIVRETGGLAMSSRNAYLSADERRRALALSQGLRLAEESFSQGEHDAEKLRRVVLDHCASTGGVQVEYVALLAEGTVDPVAVVEGPTVIAIAARVGKTRLIDNVTIG
ncbi:Pantoate-beta-alanine ligase [Pseudobythopirellula maris]|uniref:Pantothenate synthetase n=1 Tax=Pseudobythopirellula maris TaxID=2527991 RepID=A0A5C5ZUQ3_9BACT|nr:pantoate--beta-alanine ligase [Pseudobythopirellula maris]TWT91139.1 Pantoate-beta-alanine ligase [Pseudobythopirellula maris]